MSLLSNFKDWWFDVIILRFYIPLRWRKPVKINTAAFVVYSDDSYANKFRFIRECQQKKLDWPKECIKIQKKVGYRS